jgi:hypothetical protein
VRGVRVLRACVRVYVRACGGVVKVLGTGNEPSNVPQLEVVQRDLHVGRLRCGWPIGRHVWYTQGLQVQGAKY